MGKTCKKSKVKYNGLVLEIKHKIYSSKYNFSQLFLSNIIYIIRFNIENTFIIEN